MKLGGSFFREHLLPASSGIHPKTNLLGKPFPLAHPSPYMAFPLRIVWVNPAVKEEEGTSSQSGASPAGPFSVLPLKRWLMPVILNRRGT